MMARLFMGPQKKPIKNTHTQHKNMEGIKLRNNK